MRYLILGVLFCFSIFGCAQASEQFTPPEGKPIPLPDPVPEPEVGVKVVLTAFGAPWCGICSSELPKMQAALDKLSLSDRSLIEFRLYCPDETQASCDKYRDKLKLKAESFPDPKWKFFKAWVSKSLAIPGAALLNADSTKLHMSFPPGTMFLPKEIVEKALQKAKD